MSIILSSQANVSTSDGLNVLGDFGKAIGIPGFPQPPNVDSRVSRGLESLKNTINDVLHKLLGDTNQESWDLNFVESGKQSMAGGNVQGGKVPPLEEANVRQVYSQSPHVSVIIKKRVFSSLKNLYDPVFMDPAEQWLLRATKRLIAGKCAIIADYERLTKILKLEELGASPGTIIASLIASVAESNTLAAEGDTSFFTSAMNLQKAGYDRQPPTITTYFIDHDLPVLEELGPGNGVFEITMISDVSTSLALDGSGNCNFTIEDPYRILFITEQDIESALQQTALSKFVDVVSSAASLALDNAQTRDSSLNRARKSRGKSEISFTVGVGGDLDVTATIDAIGFQINEDNLADVPDNHALNDEEEGLFKGTLESLKIYQASMRKNLLSGLGNILNNTQSIRSQMEYARKKMRLFYLGKSIVQPMDTVHVLIDSGTRRLGEGDNVSTDKNQNILTTEGKINIASNVLGLGDDAIIDDDLLEIEWLQEGQHMRFTDFKKLRTMQSSGEGGLHVFGGLVNTVSDRYDASSGKFILSVSCGSNMEWLKISKYNQQPSLDQTQGIVYDPLTPFDYETDPATGLPIGKPRFSDANQKIAGCRRYFNNGPRIGTELKTIEDMEQDIRKLGGNIITLYQHAPGLVYKWKEGIQTATYNLSTVDPLDGSLVDGSQLRRDVGLFSSNTPFDNLDAANIISLLVTGFPYNPAIFIQSAINNGSYSIDTVLNSTKHYFHTFLDVQRSLNFVHGGFVPFKVLTGSPKALAQLVKTQHQLTNKSSRLSQVRTQQAALSDKISQLSSLKRQNITLLTELQNKYVRRSKELDNLENEILGIKADTEWLKGGVLEIAGNDISFDLTGGVDNFKLFSDRLTHSVLRRREQIVNNRDTNFLIISDEYDKDYDIQAFILKLKEQTPNFWKSTYMSVYQMCQEVAKILNFEIFCNTQGHIEFRPPQYNRTPVSVLNQMIALSKTSGIKIFPDFLASLFQSREESLTNDIVILEWEIRLKAALLGKNTIEEVEKFTNGIAGESELTFITNQVDIVKNAVTKRSSPKTPPEILALQKLVHKAAADSVAEVTSGTFTAVGQRNIQKNYLNEKGSVKENEISNLDKWSNQEAYIDAKKALIKLTGKRPQNFAAWTSAKVGAPKNGQSAPASDIAKIVSDIGGLVSRRARLLKTLEKVLDQNIEIGYVSEDGMFKVSATNFLSSAAFENSEIFSKLIEEDSKHILGHLSGNRFIIKDEHIISSTFEEKPPDLTNVTVTGTEPIVGEGGGNLAGVPVYTAFGVDFDMWRQYGWRGEQAFDKPFFWSAEAQCAPYAVMLLSRQRKNIVTGSVTVMGNEFYQLGDVVYVTHREMLYYVDKIQHEFSYTGGLKTTLKLVYGHPPGEYIPTPLDIIGKNLTAKGRVQGAYRIRRDRPGSDILLGTIQFQKNSTNTEVLVGQFGMKNFLEISNAAMTAQTDINERDPKISSRIYIMSFGGDETIQEQRAFAVSEWLINPSTPVEPKDGVGLSGGISLSDVNTRRVKMSKDPTNYKIPANIIIIDRIDQCVEKSTLPAAQQDLINKGITADQKSIALDNSLGSIIEIRLRQPPTGGWKD